MSPHTPASPPAAKPRRRRRRIAAAGHRFAPRGLALRSCPAEGEAVAPDPRTAALLPSELLQPGEIIILLIKPSPWFILLESLRSLVMLAVLFILTFGLARRGIWDGPRVRDFMVLLLALGVMRLGWQFLEWLSRTYVLTDRRVLRVRGVFRVHIFEAQLKHIQNTSTYFSLRERFFGLGTIGFATAAAAGSAEAYWRMVSRPLEVHQTIVQAMNRYR